MTAKYKVVSEFFYQDRMLKAGALVDFDGIPGSNLEPVNDEAKAAFAAAEDAAAKKRGALITGEVGRVSDELLVLVREQVEAIAALTARVRELESRALPPVDAFATRASVELLSVRIDGQEANTLKLREDVDEHDQGLSLLHDRLTDVENVVTALQAPRDPPPPADAPAPVTDPPPPADPPA